MISSHTNWFPRSATATSGPGSNVGARAFHVQRAGYPNRVRTINLTMRIKTFNTVKETGGGGGGGVQSMGKRFEKKKILRILIYFD